MWSWLGDNARAAVDLSARGIYNNRSNEWSSAYFVGLDVHKVFSGPSGDWGTLLLQPYLTRLDSPAHPAFFEDDHDLELVYRIFNFNYTGLAGGRFNVKVGHFEIPFGLEHVVNTNGTIRDYMHGPNIGVKADWGLSLNGELQAFDYEFSLTRGTGNEWSSRGDPWLAAGRIGIPIDETLRFGVAFFHGEVQKTALPDNNLERTRFGVDCIYDLPLFTVRAEVSAGDDEGLDKVNGIFELDWLSPGEQLQIYNQVQFFTTDLATGMDDAVKNQIGVRYAPNAHTAISAAWTQDLSVMNNGKRAGVFLMQFRYRF
jgi:hypothetical protein